jgi:hypothetical protein
MLVNACSPGFCDTGMCAGYTGSRTPKAPELGASVFAKGPLPPPPRAPQRPPLGSSPWAVGLCRGRGRGRRRRGAVRRVLTRFQHSARC